MKEQLTDQEMRRKRMIYGRKNRAYKLFARLATHARVIEEIKKGGGSPNEFPCITTDSINALWKEEDRAINRVKAFNVLMVEGKKVYNPIYESFKKTTATVTMFSIIAFCLMLSSCATLFGETNRAHQKHKPLCGEPKREIRVGYLVADLILFSPALIVDFITGKIYHPTPDVNNVKQCEGGAR